MRELLYQLRGLLVAIKRGLVLVQNLEHLLERVGVVIGEVHMHKGDNLLFVVVVEDCLKDRRQRPQDQAVSPYALFG